MTGQTKRKRKIVKLVQPEQVVGDQAIKELKAAIKELESGKFTGVAFVLTNKNDKFYTYFEGLDMGELCLGLKLLEKDFTALWEQSKPAS